MAMVACSRYDTDRPATIAAATDQTSASCRECHAEIHQAWGESDHARANRPLGDPALATAFSSHPVIADGGARFELTVQGNVCTMAEIQAGGTKIAHPVEFILGAKPLWQPLVAAPGGRWQPTDMAYDVERKEWFNVFGQEDRQPGEWGHWTGRGMNWNSMCAQCHMTGYQKNYDAATDRYASTWVEHGVGCIQCHGPMPTGHKSLPPTAKRALDAAPTAPFFGDRQRMMHTCAPCHARNEPITDDFQPGDNYFDHYRVALPSNPREFYPDGQQRDEVFNWTSVLLSRMGGHGGVTCLDCHDPHSGKTILPATDNLLCLQCHAAPGRTQPNGVRTPAIDPLAHSHHPAGSTGNSCVGCHMPTTNYMQRAARHDHGWLIPDPLLHKELGIPDACSRCHTDRPVEWSIEATERWYGPRMDTRHRRRTRAIAAAQAGAPGSREALLALWPGEDIPMWRATMLELFAPDAADPQVKDLATAALRDPDPLVRAAAVRLLGSLVECHPLVRPLLQDNVRSVRLEAAWALSAEIPADAAVRRELDAYLNLGLDQPGGRMRIGQELANRGQLPRAIEQMEQAVAWDPRSPGLHQSLGLTLVQAKQIGAAARALAKAADLDPTDGLAAQTAALALAEAKQSREAMRYLQLAVTRQPELHRAWYNLGLLQAQDHDLGAAADALARAMNLAPAVPDYPFALATVLFQQGDRDGARGAAQRALNLDPNLAEARELLMRLR